MSLLLFIFLLLFEAQQCRAQEETKLNIPCLLLYKEIKYSNEDNNDPTGSSSNHGSWECEIKDETTGKIFISTIEGLSTDFLQTNKEKMISGVSLLYAKDSIISPDRLRLTIVGEPSILDNQDHIDLYEKNMNRGVIVERTVLVVRFVSTDTQTSQNENELSNYIFGRDSQFETCSYGKTSIEPIDDIDDITHIVSKGITTINIPFKILEGVMDYDAQIRNYALAKISDLNESYNNGSNNDSSLSDLANHIMLCLPSGIQEFPEDSSSKQFTGYSYVNHWLSVYNDGYCKSMSLTSQLIGHNLGLSSSGQGNLYDGDASGLMGSMLSYTPEEEEDPDTPNNRCFNGPKSWQLKWYDDKVVTIDPIKGTFEGGQIGGSSSEHYNEPDGTQVFIRQLIGISDYDAPDDKKRDVIIKLIGDARYDYYITFNRKSGINSDTKLGANKVMITAIYNKQNSYDPSYVFSILKKGEKFEMDEYGSKGNKENHVSVIVDDINDDGGNTNTPWYATIRILVSPVTNNVPEDDGAEVFDDGDEDGDSSPSPPFPSIPQGSTILPHPCLLLYREIQYPLDSISSASNMNTWYGDLECEISIVDELTIVDGKEKPVIKTFISKIKGLSTGWLEDNDANLKSGETMFYADGAVISNDQLTLAVPSGTIPVLTPVKKAGDVAGGDRYIGEHSVLVVNFRESGVSISSEDEQTLEQILSDKIFGTKQDTSNLKSQMEACSYDKIQFNPIADYKDIVKDGVVSIEIPADGMETDADIRNFGISKLMELFDENESLSNIADHVLLCLPLMLDLKACGMEDDFVAYGFVNHWLSMYSEGYCYSMSTTVKMIGHNLGLSNSAEGNSEFGDASGLMGASYPEDDGPNICFNGVKSYELGWYKDKVAIVNPLGESWDGQLVGVSDYEMSTGRNVIVKIVGDIEYDYYVIFNRQSGINSDNPFSPDEVIVTAQLINTHYRPSYVVARLQGGKTFQLPNFGGQEELVYIKVDEIKSGTPYTAMISIIGPSGGAGPASAPTQPPGDGGSSEGCNDDPDWRFVTKILRSRSCDWVDENPDSRCEKLGMDGRAARDACRESCGTCNTV